ncbi:MAG TPA: endonuclease MutS2, partial [Eubacteriaceae bacterium]|nr:endonuclease MutS2 [Eubacteriaceae bacterium]
NGDLPIAPFEDLIPAVKKARIQSRLSLKDFIHIKRFLKIVVECKRYFGQIDDFDLHFPNHKEMDEQLDREKDLYGALDKAIFSEEDLQDQASDELYRIRKEINRKNGQIRNRLNKMVTDSSFQKFLQENIITIRQNRYVLPVKQEARGNVKGIVHDQSATGATVFIEPIAVVEWNNELRNLHLEEEKEIERILIELTRIVAESESGLTLNFHTMCKMDLIFAKARYALAINGKNPMAANTDKRVLNLKECRHPLIPQEEVVPCDLRLGEDFTTLIVTGPNTGGKTVSLKTMGLMVLMHQAGLFLPVKDGSEICIFDSVYADIGDEQSIEQSLSTFSSHMTNIVNIMNRVEKGSLVLLDELGAGTDPVEGAALAMSLLDFLHKNQAYTMITTHYSELKQYALATKGVENASVEFDVQSLRPTYKLTIGIPGKSNAFEISKRLGLKEEIIQQARSYLGEETVHFEDLIAQIQEDKKTAHEELEKARSLRNDNEKLLKRNEQLNSELMEKQNKEKEKAALEASQIVYNAREEAREIIKQLQSLKLRTENEHFKEAEKLRRDLRDVEEQVFDKISSSGKGKSSGHKKSDEKIKEGDTVQIQSMGQKAIVLDSPDKDGKVTVQAGIMKLQLPVSDLTKIEEQKQKPKGTSGGKVRKAMDVRPSIDVRGMNIEEAIMDVEKYIDDAYLSNLKTVTVIHGKGTGKLREGLHKAFKRHKQVDSYRIGGFREGGDGATIVTLK